MPSRSGAAKKKPAAQKNVEPRAAAASKKAEPRSAVAGRGASPAAKAPAARVSAVAATPARLRVAPAAAKVTGTTLSDAELIELARAAVPKALRDGGVVRRPARAALTISRAGGGGSSLDEEVAALVGAKLPPARPDTATVEFVSETALGKRNTVVHVRGNKVTRVMTRAAR